jgi:transcriptional regulator with GAF, ATPase, and Fis domain
MQHEDADWYKRFFEVFARIAHLFASDREQHEVLAEVLEELYFNVGLVRGTVMLFSPSGTDLFVQTPSASLSPWHRSLRYRPRDGVLGAAIQARHPVILQRASEDTPERADTGGIDDCARETIDFVCAPILLDEEVCGTLSADLPAGVGRAIEVVLRFLKATADLIASDVRRRRSEASGGGSPRGERVRIHAAEGIASESYPSEAGFLRRLQEQIWKLDECVQDAIRSSDLPPTADVPAAPLRLLDLREAADEGPLKALGRLMEKMIIREAFRSTDGSMKRAAAQLGISTRMLHYKVISLGIDRLWFKQAPQE